jgi:serine/threonine kinase 17
VFEVVQEICGTPEYTAPEILNYNPITTAADLWSLGAVLYVMLTGYSPFAGESLHATYLNVAKACLSFPDDERSQHSPDSIELIVTVNQML